MSSFTDRRKALGGVLACAAILGVCLFVLARLSRDDLAGAFDLPRETYLHFYLLLAFVQLLSLCLWRAYASVYGVRRAASDAFVDTGLLALGKYVPGKIWGLLARGAVGPGGIRVDRRRLIVSVSEQASILGVGLLVAGVLGLAARYAPEPLLTAALLALSVAFGAFVLASVRHRVPWLRVDGLSGTALGTHCLWLAAGYALLWLASAAPIVLLVWQGTDVPPSQILPLTSAFLTAMIAGWIAFFAPGGIGVREAVFVSLAPSFLSWEQGLFWITLHRSLSLAFDLVFGLTCFAIVAFRTRGTATA